MPSTASSSGGARKSSSIIGETALVDVSYHLPNGPVNARFTLERIKGVWLITAAR